MKTTGRPNAVFTTLRLAGVLILLHVTGCATAPETETDVQATGSGGEIEYPEWILSPPVRDGYLYGIGSDPDTDIARQKALVDVGMQLETRVHHSLEEHTGMGGSELQTVVGEMNRQFSDVEVIGAKFADQWDDDSGSTWILTQAPLNCLLDVAESVLISYQMTAVQDDPEFRGTILEVLDETERKITASPEWVSSEPRVVPWTRNARGWGITVDGNADDWENIPVYFEGLKGDASRPDTDLDYIKCVMDDEFAYVLLACVGDRWAAGITFEINFDYTDGTLYSPTGSTGSDLHTNFNSDDTNFWDQGSDSSGAYNPGVKRRTRGPYFEFAIPLERYDASRFNVVYCNTWMNGSTTDRTIIPVSHQLVGRNELERLRAMGVAY